jgi:hypothetical protein
MSQECPLSFLLNIVYDFLARAIKKEKWDYKWERKKPIDPYVQMAWSYNLKIIKDPQYILKSNKLFHQSSRMQNKIQC